MNSLQHVTNEKLKVYRYIVQTLLIIFLIVFNAPHVNSQQKINGPWSFIWFSDAQCMGNGLDNDYFSRESNGQYSESYLSRKGIKLNEKIGKRKWVIKELSLSNNNLGNLIRSSDKKFNYSKAVVYGMLNVYSNKNQKVMMRIGSDDTVKIWVNGKVLHRNVKGRGASGFQDEFQIILNRGKNIILAKVINCRGRFSFFAGIQAEFTAGNKRFYLQKEISGKRYYNSIAEQHYKKFKIYKKSKNYKAALRKIIAAEKAAPTNWLYTREKAQLYYHNIKDYKKAVPFYLESYLKGYDEPWILTRVGTIYIKEKQLQKELPLPAGRLWSAVARHRFCLRFFGLHP